MIANRIELVTLGDEGVESERLDRRSTRTALSGHLRAVFGRESPFFWFAPASHGESGHTPPLGTHRWKDSVVDPATVCRAYADHDWARLLTPRNVAELVRSTLEQKFSRTGDTLTPWKRHEIFQSLRRAIAKTGAPLSQEEEDELDASLDAAAKTALKFLHEDDRAGAVVYATTPSAFSSGRAASLLLLRGGSAALRVPGGDALRSSIQQMPAVLDQEQTGVALEILGALRGSGIACLVGPGGSGKTHIVAALVTAVGAQLASAANNITDDAAVKAKRRVVVVAAPTNKAVSVLAKKLGPSATRVFGTLHSLCRVLTPEGPLEPILLVIDEASMLAQEHTDLICGCRPLAKAPMLLVGDDLQLPPVGPGDVLRDVMHHFDFSRLTGNHRVEGRAGASLAASLLALRGGNLSRGLQGRVSPLADSGGVEDRRNTAVLEAVQQWTPTLVVCLRHAERNAYNTHCVAQHSVPDRLVRYDDYRKDPPPPYLRSFVPYQGLPVVFTSNTQKSEGACRGALGIVSHVSFHGAKADVLVSLEADGSNRSAEIQGALPASQLVRVVGPCWELRKDLAVAYAVTVHSAQSVGSPKVAIILPPNVSCPLLTLEMLYTAASRASCDFRVFSSADVWEGICDKLSRRAPRRTTVLDLFLRRGASS